MRLTIPNLVLVFGLYLFTGPVFLDSLHRLADVFVEHLGSQQSHIDIRYITHPWISLLHIGSGCLYLGLAPLQFWTALRFKASMAHRWIGRLAVLSGTLSAIALMVMVFAFPALGGGLTQGVSVMISLAMIGFFWTAIVVARQRDIKTHKAFMLRAYCLGLSVATARYLLWAADIMLGVPFENAFVFASGAGVVINVFVGELLLHNAQRR